MGFSLSIETDFGAEKLMNIHPDGDITGGGAVFAFLSGLQNYCDFTPQKDADPLQHVYDWYQRLDSFKAQPLCVSCKELLACIWGDGGDSFEYGEGDYALFLHRTRNSCLPPLSEEQFQQMLEHGQNSWRPIELVIHGVQTLLHMFRHTELSPLEGFFSAEATVRDFEALLANLQWLMERGNETVRLNFS